MAQPSDFTVLELLRMKACTERFIMEANARASRTWIARDENLNEAKRAQKELNMINEELAKR